jgi:hypothetical protein
MPAQKPDPKRSRLAYALQLRLTKAQYAYLLLRADENGSMAEALRQVLDDAIDSQPVYADLGDDYDGPAMRTGTGMRSILEHVDLDNLDDATRAMLARRDEE